MRAFLLMVLVSAVSFAPVRAGAGAADIVPGPVIATVIEVIDGDTVRVRARPWPGLEAVIKIRLADIDAPDIRRAKCPAERAAGVRAKAALAAKLAPGSQVSLTRIHPGKYAGRMVAFMTFPSGGDVTAWLRRSGLTVTTPPCP